MFFASCALKARIHGLTFKGENTNKRNRLVRTSV
jgi:hypothetical protein